MNPALTVSLLDLEDSEEWDRFVLQEPGGLPTQLHAWRAIMLGYYGYQGYFLIARQADRVQGVLPLYQVSSLLTGKRLVSLPGAVCAETAESARALIDMAEALARDLGMDYLLLRDSRQEWPGAGLDIVCKHRGVRRSLTPDVETVWRSLGKRTRTKLNKARENNLSVTIDPSCLEDFYRIFLTFNRDLGTPLFGLDFLRQITNRIAYTIALTRHAGLPIVGHFNFLFNRSIYNMWVANQGQYRELNANLQTYWETIALGCQTGFTQLDLGRSPYPSGQYDFKTLFGDSDYPIYQLFKIFRGKTPVELLISLPDEDAFSIALFRRLWQGLPAPLAGLLGPTMRRHLPFG